MLSTEADLDKPGIWHLKNLRNHAIIVNKTLHERGQATKFAVVNVRMDWVNNVFRTPGEATTYVQELYQT